MARLIPDIPIEDIASKPERDVARTLVDQLPNDVWIFHSYPWLRPERNDRTGKKTLREGETDFLVLWPDLGLLILEVKGGDVRYVPDTRRWYRLLDGGRERDIEDPFAQANKNTHAIVDTIAGRVYGGANPRFAFGYSVIFPDCAYSGAMPPGAEPATILSAGDLPKIKDAIGKALRRWSRRDPPHGLADDELRRVKEAILPRFSILAVLHRTIADQEEKLFRLTEEQIRLLEFLGENHRAAIEGVAGSGKTLLAKAQAQHFADQGLKTLFLCYNKSLAGWLRDSLSPELRQSIHVHHFHGLCSEWCRRARMSFRPPVDGAGEFWRHEAAELLWEAIEALDERYDAVVVDEAQDFFPDWWDPIELINGGGNEGRLYVFYDPAQNLYNEHGISIPALGRPYSLPTNCRNTQAIARTCGEILDREIRIRPGAPHGVETEMRFEVEDGEAIAALNGWVKDWVKRQGVKQSQIAVLSPFRRANSCLANRTHFAGITITEDLDEWQDDAGVLFSTIRSFKGLESDIVVLVDVVEPGTNKAFSRSDFYVACSRAKHLLKVLAKVPESRLLDESAKSGRIRGVPR